MARKHDVLVFHQLRAFNWIRIFFSSIQFIPRQHICNVTFITHCADIYVFIFSFYYFPFARPT